MKGIRTLLVIEDNPGDARLLREMFHEIDGDRPQVIQVDTMLQAEQRLASDGIDVILLDLGLPDAEGLEAVRRAHAAAPHTPLVILTGLDDEAMATDALQIGAQDYLIKGEIEPRTLTRALRYAVERSLLDAALWAERERAQVTLDSIGDAVASMDLAGTVTFLNAAAQRITGWTVDDAIGRPAARVLAFRDRAIRALLASGSATLAPDDAPVILPPSASIAARDGREVAVEGSIGHIHDRRRRAVGSVVVFRDVTARRATEQAMRRSEERFRRLFDSNTIAITIAELSGRLLDANDAYLDLIGYTRDEALAKEMRWDDLTPPEHREATARSVGQLLATGVAQPFEKEYRRRDGVRVQVLVGAAMLEASAGTCISYIVDLSGRRTLEEQLRQAQKMEAIGQLAGGIAHDFNNLLTVILGHAELLRADDIEPEDGRASLDEIWDAGVRAAGMTRQLLAFSRRQVLAPTVLDLNVLIADLATLLGRMIGEDVRLVTGSALKTAIIRADPGQIGQVLMNLAVNARDAMPRGGTLTVTVGEQDVAPGTRSNPSALPPGPYVTITVVDSGTGMSPETMTHMFEPFYTTKGSDNGTGLGLATAYGIVKQSGGDIRVVSEPGRGTTFVILLPRCDATPDATRGRDRVPSSPLATETVLLVEDEAAVRRLTRRMLETRGYHVVEASSGREAVAIAAATERPIELLVTDVVMPGMSGPELAAALGAVRPEMRVLLISGYSDEKVVADGAGNGHPLLMKPFTPLELADKLREVVAADPLAPGRPARISRARAARAACSAGSASARRLS